MSPASICRSPGNTRLSPGSGGAGGGVGMGVAAGVEVAAGCAVGCGVSVGSGYGPAEKAYSVPPMSGNIENSAGNSGSGIYPVRDVVLPQLLPGVWRSGGRYILVGYYGDEVIGNDHRPEDASRRSEAPDDLPGRGISALTVPPSRCPLSVICPPAT